MGLDGGTCVGLVWDLVSKVGLGDLKVGLWVLNVGLGGTWSVGLVWDLVSKVGLVWDLCGTCLKNDKKFRKKIQINLRKRIDLNKEKEN